MGDGRWDDFRYFLSVAKSSSIKRAAVELQTTQSAVSKRLDRLERTLGVRLVDRGHAGTKLTYQGELVLNHAMAAEAALTRAQKDAHAAESRIEGDCSILLGDGVANYWIAPFLDSFFSVYPDIELKMVLDHDLTAPRNEIFDIRLHYHAPSDTAQIAKPLCTVHFMPFASRGYLSRHGTPHCIGDLANHRLIDQAQYLISRGSWATWFENAQLKRTSLFTNQSTFLARAVQAGVGIALMPTYMTLIDPDFVPLDIEMRFSLRLFASYQRERALKQPVRMTLNYLRDRVFDTKNMPWFASEFAPPDPHWNVLHAQGLGRARSDSPRAHLAAQLSL